MIKFYKNKDWLIEQYLNQKKSARQIGKEYNIGKTTILEQLKKFNIPRRTISEALKGNKNNQWKGDNAGIIALHIWIRRYKPKPITCEICNKNRPFDLANISGEYKRDINDYQWLCRRCHMESDGRMNNRNEKGQFTKKD